MKFWQSDVKAYNNIQVFSGYSEITGNPYKF